MDTFIKIKIAKCLKLYSLHNPVNFINLIAIKVYRENIFLSQIQIIV